VVDGRLLEGRIAVVTGGAGGIGEGIARSLHGAGATLILNDINETRLAALADELRATGTAPHLVPGDIRDESTVTRVAETASGVDDGRVDVLVNNVGDYRPPGRFFKTTPAEWHALYAINFEHVLRLTHAIAPLMVANGCGSIVNVTTVEAHRGIPRNAVYSAYKAAIWAFTRSLAVELGNDGVRVNAIAPDMADTFQTPATMMLGDRDPALVRCWIPLGRFGEPADYGDVVLFLASDLSRFVTGETIAVDGGTLAASGWYRRVNGRGWTNLPDAP
jgi:2-hydroxycyclohexanecarboxyl-CoA dehydrogenase